MLLRRALVIGTLLAGCTFSDVATANGRLPNTTFFRINPYDTQQWLVGATFGLVLSQDGGNSFQWLCEQAANGPTGFAGADPVALWWGPNRLALAVYDTVLTTQDGGCTWAAAHDLANLSITDLAGHPTDPNTWFVGTLDLNTAMGKIFKTTDAGATYTALSLALPNIGWQSVRVATADGQRMVAVGWQTSSFVGPYLALSTDAGATWRNTLITGGPDGVSGPQVTVSPADPNVLLVAITPVGSGASATLLMRVAADTGAGTVVATLADGYRGAAFAANGQTAWVATPTRLLRSTDGGASFTPLAAPIANACVDLEGSTLYACGNDMADAFALASSSNDGTTWSPKYSLASTAAPLSCPAGSPAQTICPALWPNTATAIHARLPTPASVASPAKPAAKKQGCSCNGAGAGAAWVLALGAALARRYQRS